MIHVIVQAAPGRDEAWARSKASIEASDIGTHYDVMVNPPNVPPRNHFLNVMRTLFGAPTKWVLRLEDDAIVNRYVIHNLETWPATRESDFGAGWLFAPGGWKGERLDRPYLHGSVGVLLERKHIPRLIQRCMWWFEHNQSTLSQDLALSRAVWMGERRIYVHQPPLVEHPIDVPSATKHQHTPAMSTTQGAFSAEWRRAAS